MKPELAAIAVKIPAGTEGAFKKLVAAWVEGIIGSRDADSPAAAPLTDTDDLLPRAVDFWRSLSGTERAIFGLWVDIAPNLVAADKMAEQLSLKSTNSIRGHIRRFAEKATEAGFQAGWQSHERDALSGQPLYGLRDFGTGEFGYDRLSLGATEYASLLARARAIVEQE